MSPEGLAARSTCWEGEGVPVPIWVHDWLGEGLKGRTKTAAHVRIPGGGGTQTPFWKGSQATVSTSLGGGCWAGRAVSVSPVPSGLAGFPTPVNVNKG